MKLLPGNLALNFVDFFQGMRVFFFFFYIYFSRNVRSIQELEDLP